MIKRYSHSFSKKNKVRSIDINFKCDLSTAERIPALAEKIGVSKDEILEIATIWLSYYTLQYDRNNIKDKTLLELINEYRDNVDMME